MCNTHCIRRPSGRLFFLCAEIKRMVDNRVVATYSGDMINTGEPSQRTFWKSTVKRFIRDRRSMLGLCLVGVLSLLTLCAPLVSPRPPDDIKITESFMEPAPGRWLGTDDCGRDVLSRIVYGGRATLVVGILSVALYTLAGVLIGSVSGYCGGVVDFVLSRLIDVFMCFPPFFLALAALAIVEHSITNIVLVIALTGWPGLARLVRTEVVRLKSLEFVEAARMTGARPAALLFRHILPNLAGPVVVAATLGVGSAILVECGLTFLGLGLPHDIPSWGQLLSAGRDAVQYAWWLSLFPGMAILGAVAGCNLIGESLRDALDPRFVP